MKPIPKSGKERGAYPTREEHNQSRRQFLQSLGLAGAGFGLAFAATGAAADEPTRKDLVKRIKVLGTKLGDASFKVRRNATRDLLAIARVTSKDKKVDAEARQLVLHEMKVLLKHKDPEIAQRAKQIIVTLTPKPKPPPEHQVPLKGEVMVDGVWE